MRLERFVYKKYNDDINYWPILITEQENHIIYYFHSIDTMNNEPRQLYITTI